MHSNCIALIGKARYTLLNITYLLTYLLFTPTLGDSSQSSVGAIVVVT